MILWIIACIACFVLGDLKGQGKLNWVRGAAGKARGVVFGLRPARNSNPTSNLPRGASQWDKPSAIPASNVEFKPDISPDIPKPVPPGIFGEIPVGNVSPTPPKNPIRPGQALKNILAFIGGLLAWMAKNPIVAIGLVLLACLLVFGLPFGLGKSKGELRLERELAEANARVAEHEARLGQIARDLAVNTERDRTRRTQVIAQAEQEIEDAAAQVDPRALSDAYESRYLCVLDPSTCAGSANPAPSGPAPMRGAGAGPV